MRQARADIESLGATVLAVAGGAGDQARALMAQGLWFPCLIDADRRLYRALGLGHIGLGWLDPLGWWSYLRARRRGSRQGRVTNPLQAPGVAILDARAQARWVWRGRTLGDYPPLPSVLARLRSVA